MNVFLVSKLINQFFDVYQRLTDLLKEDKIQHTDDMSYGIENVPNTQIKILEGENFGIPLIEARK